MSLTWITPPSELVRALDQYERDVREALRAVAIEWAESVQSIMRDSRPWTDQTGDARAGLFYAVDGFGMGPVIGQIPPASREKMTDVATVSGDKDTLVVAAGHSVFYGKWLELKNGGRYAVVMSVIQANLPKLEQMLRSVVNG